MINLRCILFGHKFLEKTKFKKIDSSSIDHPIFVYSGSKKFKYCCTVKKCNCHILGEQIKTQECCQNCGLTKEECGIKLKNN